jgi:hypothetical protein
MGSAAGEVIPLILLIAVTEMSDNDFEFYPVVGMTHQNIIDRTGYLCFTKTRAGNVAFFKWFIEFFFLWNGSLHMV